jgi:hypothetical protein
MIKNSWAVKNVRWDVDPVSGSRNLELQIRGPDPNPKEILMDP